MSLPKSIFQITLGSLNLNPHTFDNLQGKILSKVNKTHQGYVTARTGPHFLAFLYHRIQLRISTVICCSGKRKNAYVLVWYGINSCYFQNVLRIVIGSLKSPRLYASRFLDRSVLILFLYLLFRQI